MAKYVKVPDNFVIEKQIMDGPNTVGVRKIDLSFLPAADVIPVKRAHWIISETDYGFCEAIGKNYKERKYKCSACGYETGTQAEKFICCPICTAKMDGGTP